MGVYGLACTSTVRDVDHPLVLVSFDAALCSKLRTGWTSSKATRGQEREEATVRYSEEDHGFLSSCDRRYKNPAEREPQYDTVKMTVSSSGALKRGKTEWPEIPTVQYSEDDRGFPYSIFRREKSEYAGSGGDGAMQRR